MKISKCNQQRGPKKGNRLSQRKKEIQKERRRNKQFENSDGLKGQRNMESKRAWQ